MVGRASVVRNNFVKCNDDALKLFKGETLWGGNTIWQEDNGQSFMLSWITSTNERNISVFDSTVIHVEHDHDYGDDARPSVFGSVHGGAGTIGGYIFRNVTVEGDVFRPVGFVVAPNPWGGSSTGEIDGIEMGDIHFLGNARAASLIHGVPQRTVKGGDGVVGAGAGPQGAGAVVNVLFRGLDINGVPITDAERGDAFVIDQATTANITFSSDTE